jgi:hypothetical protein
VTGDATLYVAFESGKRSGGYETTLKTDGWENTGETMDPSYHGGSMRVWTKSVKQGTTTLPGTTTKATTMSISAKTQDTSCFVTNTKYLPFDDVSTGKTIEKSAAKCQARCARVEGCSYFTYFEDHGYCHLSSSAAKKETWNDGPDQPKVTAGVKRCTVTANEDVELGDSDDIEGNAALQAKIARHAVPPSTAKSLILGESMQNSIYHVLTEECQKECGDVRGLVRQIYAKEKACGMLDIEMEAEAEKEPDDQS